jgi:hypothetical protein
MKNLKYNISWWGNLTDLEVDMFHYFLRKKAKTMFVIQPSTYDSSMLQQKKAALIAVIKRKII